MPNIRSQEITADHIHIVASDGREVTISRAKLADEFAATKTGTTDERKVAVGDVVKAMIVAALGEDQVEADLLDFDFDPADSKRPPELGARERIVEPVPPDRSGETEIIVKPKRDEPGATRRIR